MFCLSIIDRFLHFLFLFLVCLYESDADEDYHPLPPYLFFFSVQTEPEICQREAPGQQRPSVMKISPVKFHQHPPPVKTVPAQKQQQKQQQQQQSAKKRQRQYQQQQQQLSVKMQVKQPKSTKNIVREQTLVMKLPETKKRYVPPMLLLGTKTKMQKTHLDQTLVEKEFALIVSARHMFDDDEIMEISDLDNE